MPRHITWEDGAEVTRRGRSDVIDTNVGVRPARVFRGDLGTWRLTNLGKRYYASIDGLSEYVWTLPVIFIIQRPDGTTVRHRGYYPLTDVDLRLAAHGGDF